MTLLQKLFHMKLEETTDRRSRLSKRDLQDLGFLMFAFDSFPSDTPFEMLVQNGWSNWETKRVKELHEKMFPEFYQ